MWKLRLYALLCVLVTAGMSPAIHISGGDIVLADEPLSFTPQGYYIHTVSDGRIDAGPIATMVVTQNNKPVIIRADLHGGTLAAVSGFIGRNLKKDVTARPVNINIKNFILTETLLPAGGVDGQIQIGLVFSQTKAYGEQQLIEYRGGVRYTRTQANNKLIEAQLRAVLKSALVYFNNWMRDNVPTNPILARAVTFNFADYHDEVEGDTIYYSPTRPLTWNDFQAKIRPSGPYNAMVMPGFGYDVEQQIKDGVINVHVKLKAYVAKSDSWSDRRTNSDYALNHEQKHFDIARIITNRYRQKVLAAGLTPDTYEAFLTMQYLESYREMNAMQRAYDKETRNGINADAQLEWNKKIDAMLKE